MSKQNRIWTGISNVLTNLSISWWLLKGIYRQAYAQYVLLLTHNADFNSTSWPAFTCTARVGDSNFSSQQGSARTIRENSITFRIHIAIVACSCLRRVRILALCVAVSLIVSPTLVPTLMGCCCCCWWLWFQCKHTHTSEFYDLCLWLFTLIYSNR